MSVVRADMYCGDSPDSAGSILNAAAEVSTGVRVRIVVPMSSRFYALAREGRNREGRRPRALHLHFVAMGGLSAMQDSPYRKKVTNGGK